MPFYLIAQSVADACGVDPGSVCGLVYDLTGSSGAARVADLATRPLKVLLILFLAWIISRIVRRWLDRLVEGWLSRRSELAEAISGTIEPDDDGPGLGEAALERARRLVDQQERAASGRERSVRCCGRSPRRSSTEWP